MELVTATYIALGLYSILAPTYGVCIIAKVFSRISEVAGGESEVFVTCQNETQRLR
jgi:RAB protein geranylgeranyltransferase component A